MLISTISRTGSMLLLTAGTLLAASLTGCNNQDNAPQVDATPNKVSDPEVPDMATVVNMSDSPHAFTPQNIEVPPSKVITWTNTTKEPHSVTVDPGQREGWPGSDTEYPNGIPSGSTYTFMVPHNTAIGTVWYYHCRFHGKPGNGQSVGTGMAGSVLIIDPTKK